ncbi:MAG TPA: hypothetical protein VFV52_08085, partial [Bacilli bacterium]|nr:hypothetical protein [Bacilli bacterium]
SAVGVAVMGALMNARIISTLSDNPDIQAPLDEANLLLDEKNRGTLSPDLIDTLRNAFDSGLHQVFLVIGIFGVLGLLVTLFFPRQEKQKAEAPTAR